MTVLAYSSKLFLSALLSLCIVLPTSAEDYFSLSLEELMSVEVSGATFSEESLMATPASVTVFTSADIDRMAVNWVHELANYVPGFQSKRQSDNVHHYSLSARGRQIGTGTRSVKIVINGQPVTSGYIASSSASIYGIPTGDISKIEFIRGPGSAVHGSGALLGIINIETYPNDSDVSFRLGSHEFYGGSFRIRKKDYYMSGSFSGDAGHEYRLLEPDTLERVESKDPKQDFHIYLGKDKGETQFSFHHHRRNENGYYGFDRVDNLANRSSRSYTSFSLEHIMFSDAYFELTGKVFANNRFAQFGGRLLPAGMLSAISSPSSDDPLLASTEADSNQYGLFLLADHLFLEGNFSIGAEYVYSEVVDAIAWANFDIEEISQYPETGEDVTYFANNPKPIPFVEPHTNQTVSIFSELQYRLLADLNSIFSLRYDYADNIGDSEILPRMALVYAFSENQYIKYIYSEAFRNPGAIELHATNNSTLLGNEDLKSEVVRSNEIIWTYQSFDFFTNLSLFENQIENSIEQSVVDGKRVFLNQENETNRGLELEFRIKPIESVHMNLTYQYLDETLDSAFRLSRDSGSIVSQWSNERWMVGLNSYYHSKSSMYINDTPELADLPAFWHHSIKVSYKPERDMTASLFIGNLENRTVYTPTISTILSEGLPSRGRQVILSFQSKL